MRRRRCQC